RLQMRTDNAIGNEARDSGGVVVSVLDVVKGFRPDSQAFRIAGVPLGHTSVEVPAVIIKLATVGNLSDLLQRLVFELAESHGDVGDLHAGIVDVILYFDLTTEESQHSSERIPKRGVSQVTDMRGLVRIDGGVFD